MAAAALQYSPATQQRSLVPSRRSQRIPGEHLVLKQHRNFRIPERDHYTPEEITYMNRKNLDIDYKVKIPKPLYREATEARRAAHMRTRLRPMSYAATPKAPKDKGPAAVAPASPGGFSPVRPIGFHCAPPKRFGYTPSLGPEPL